jgi:DNA-binding transcriptional ArsR family regulator
MSDDTTSGSPPGDGPSDAVPPAAGEARGEQDRAGGPADRLSGRILDAAALKALAHPLRFQLVELLLERGPSTASELGRQVGESSGSTSYHLRQLAAQGLIEEASELGNARDRYWRPVRGGWSLAGLDLLEDRSVQEDARFVLGEVVRARFERVERWHREAPRWGPEWVERTLEMTARFRLTADELEALTSDLVAVIERYKDLQASRHDGPPPPGTVPVSVQLDAFPTGEPPTEGAPDVET